VPSASPAGTPKHSMRKMTTTEDPKGPQVQGLFMMPPAGVGLGSLKSDFVPSASIKQRGQQAVPPVSQSSSSPGKRRGKSWGLS
jgi:vacuolar protein sorting-associated protein 13D